MPLQLTPVPNFLNNPSPFAYLTAANQQSMQNALNTQQFQQNQTNLSSLAAKNQANINQLNAQAKQQSGAGNLNQANANQVGQNDYYTQYKNWVDTVTSLRNAGYQGPMPLPPTQINSQQQPITGGAPNPQQVNTANNSLSNAPNLPILPQSPQQQQQASNATAAFGAPMTITPDQINAMGGNAAASPTQGQGTFPAMSPNNLTPMQQRDVAQAGQKSQLDQQVKDLAALHNSANQGAAAAQEMNKFLDSAQQHYNAPGTYTGPFWGALAEHYDPGSPSLLGTYAAATGHDMSNENLVNNALANIVADKAKTMVQGAGGRLTNMDFVISGKTKPNPAMSPAAFNTSVEQQRTMNTRSAEASQMYNYFESQKNNPAYSAIFNNGVLNPYLAKAIFNQYDSQRPGMDTQSNPTKQNLNSWQDFATPEAVNAFASGQKFTPEPFHLQNAPGMTTMSASDYANGLMNALANGRTKEQWDAHLEANHRRVGGMNG